MDWRRPRQGKNRNVFKGTVLVSTLLGEHPRRFKSRAVAVKFAKRLFREGLIRSIFGARSFEDSAQLYMWQDEDDVRRQHPMMTSTNPSRHHPKYSVPQKEAHGDRLDLKLVDDVKKKILNRGDNLNIVTSFNTFFQELERDFPDNNLKRQFPTKTSFYPWEVKRESTCSTDSSVDTQTYFRNRDKSYYRYPHVAMASARGPHVIPEEHNEMTMERANVPLGYEMTQCNPGTLNSHTSSGGTVESIENHRRWAEPVYSYSDNEKQLIEEMKRMKKEHQHILKTYEERINKLMAKMHELRSIAEMLENSSTKSSPYGILPAKASLLNIIGSKLEEERKQAVAALTQNGDLPPPLPPRPSRGNKVYPNKPIIHTRVKMKSLPWIRIILTDSGSDGGHTSIWHSMLEPKVDTDEIEKLFSKILDSSSSDDVTLYDDVYFQRGRLKQQPLTVFDSCKSERISTELRNLRCTVNDIVQALSTLDSANLNKDSLAELLELMNSPREIDKILHLAKRKGAGVLDCPEYLVFELSKVDHFRERLEFLRFKHKLQINLFEIDQQLRELKTACDEITNSIALKNLLETLLSVGNYLNGGSERGQADGFHLDILKKLKELTDKTKRGNLLEFILKMYVRQYEGDADLGCPTRFRLPEPSNMRHAAQVSFDDIQRAMTDLREELMTVREKVDSLSKRQNSNLTQGLRVASENFMSCALEVVFDQEKVLEESKTHFLKTTTYFLHDNRQSSPQEFFHIWATFLHDCKYYWKLAHRNLARNKFELEFSSKSQLSSSSVPGFYSFKSKMLKHLSSLQDDKDMRVSKAQQLKHINNWIESVGKYTQDMKAEQPALSNKECDQEDALPYTSSSRSHRPTSPKQRSSHSHRPSSPKPMTSTPPNVHKPLAINHTSPITVQAQSQQAPSSAKLVNYENQEQAYESLCRAKLNNEKNEQNHPSPQRPQASVTAQENTQKRSAQFSLKSWLKRDQNKRSDEDVNQISNQSPNQNELSNTKQPSSGNPFGKLRNTVVQKFSGANTTKRSPEQNQNSTLQRDSRKSTRHANELESANTTYRGQLVSVAKPFPQTADNTHQHPLSQAVDNAHHNRVHPDYQNFIYESSPPRDTAAAGTHSTPSTLSGSRSRDSSPVKYDVSRSARQRHGSGQRHKKSDTKYSNPATWKDNNNNTNTLKVSPQSASRPRDRAPIALGSNLSISDVYNKPGEEEEHAAKNVNTEVQDLPVGQISNVDSKWVKATAVPVYKAKLIPNYENQMRIDPRLEGQVGVRGQAEPVQPSHMHQSSTTSDDYRQMLQRKSEMYVPGGYTSMQNIKKMTHESSRHGRTKTDPPARRSISAGNLPDRHSHTQAVHATPVYPQHHSSDRKQESGKSVMAPREKGPMNAHSITSLIERFEKGPHPDDLNMARPMECQAEFEGKAASMTSTPLTRRKHQSQNDETQSSLLHKHELHTKNNYSDHSTTNHVNSNYGHYQAQGMSQHPGYQSSPIEIPPPMPAHSHPQYNLDNYSDQLRKVAKHSSVFDRYSKASPPYGRHGGSPGAMAVVKPTVVHQGPVTFMEI